MQVMRALNFLSSSGECFLIVGMEEKAVTNAVAVSLSGQFDVQEGRELPAADRTARRWEYARLWMEKLIQIRVPVPSPDDDQFKALLRGARGYPAFRAEEIRRPEAFAARLRNSTDLCFAYLREELFTPAMADWLEQREARETGPAWLRRPLAEGLSRLVDGPLVHEPERFARIVLRPETRALLDHRPQGETLRLLNRMLLEDALVTELAAPFIERFQQWAVRTWERSRPFVLLGAILACTVTGYLGIRQIMPARPAADPPPPPVWETHSVIAPDRVTAILLESPEGLPGRHC